MPKEIQSIFYGSRGRQVQTTEPIRQGARAPGCCIPQINNRQTAKLKFLLFQKFQLIQCLLHNAKDTIPSLRVCRLPLEVGGDEVNDLPHAVPSGGLRLRYRAIDHGRQRNGRVVAPEAGQDVLRHHPDQLATLGFELTSKDRLQAMESI